MIELLNYLRDTMPVEKGVHRRIKFGKKSVVGCNCINHVVINDKDKIEFEDGRTETAIIEPNIFTKTGEEQILNLMARASSDGFFSTVHLRGSGYIEVRQYTFQEGVMSYSTCAIIPPVDNSYDLAFNMITPTEVAA